MTYRLHYPPIMVGLAIPADYFMARSRHKNLYMLPVIVPFWTNFLIRVYAWTAILGNNGILNSTLLSTGFIREHIQLALTMLTTLGVLLFMRLNRSAMEAGREG